VIEHPIYLDHAATTPVREEALAAMWPYFGGAFANPSSVHSPAVAPRDALATARSMVAAVLGCAPDEVIFTAGGTESDAMAILGVARASAARGCHIITTTIEHEAVLAPCRQLEREGFDVTYLPVDRFGRVDPEVLVAAVRPDTILASIMLANNEIGTLQPIAEIASLLRARGVLVHTDAVQAAGALDLSVDRLGVDLLTLSAHKIYGPKGVGALYVRRGTPLEPLVPGGGQERGRRGGTENIPGIIGFAVALNLASDERERESARLIDLRQRLIEGVLATVPGVVLTGHPTLRLPGHASFVFDGVSGEAVLVDLDMAGIACSSGSACKAGSTDPSHVLVATGFPPFSARNGLRMTMGRETTSDDIDRVLALLPQIVDELHSGVTA
jgi:cysteine desulfurase